MNFEIILFCQNHSQCNRTVCGGDDFYARDDCVAMGEDGEWTEVGTLVEFRTDHACWDIGGEVCFLKLCLSNLFGAGALMLFGGSYQEQSTEVFNLDSGVAESSYTLEYPSRGSIIVIIMRCVNHIKLCQPLYSIFKIDDLVQVTSEIFIRIFI